MATTITAITGGTVTSRSEQSKQFQGLFSVIPFIATLTDATLPAQTSSQVAITVPGAALGDFVLISYPGTLTGIVLSAAVSAANTVLVTAFNTEGSDAVTSLSGGLIARGIVLKTRAEVWDRPAA